MGDHSLNPTNHENQMPTRGGVDRAGFLKRSVLAGSAMLAGTLAPAGAADAPLAIPE